MIPVEIYTATYYLVLSITILLSILPLFFKKDIESFPKINLYVGTFLILILVLAFIGFRDPYASSKYFGDTIQYTSTYNQLDNATYGEKKDIGFYSLMVLCKSLMNIQSFYILCSLLYVIPVYYTFRKWFKEYAFFALILFVSSMSFWGFGVNGIRNGLATSLFIFALGFQGKIVITISLMVLSITFHSSLMLPFIAYLLTLKLTNTKILIKVWIFSVVISFFIGNQIEALLGDFFISSGFTDDKRLDTYFSNEIDGEIADKRYRFDFIVYSGIPIAIGYFYKYKLLFNSIIYDRIFNLYLVANTVWVFLIYLAFTNRMAYLSWFLIPVVLVYPILVDKSILTKKSLLLGTIIVGSLAFTLLIFLKT